MQEASEVIAMGGGFQVYYTQNRDASLKPWTFPGMAKIATFCRDRQPFCKEAKPLPQIAVLYSTFAFYKFAHIIYDYNPDVIANEAKGVTMSLLDKQYSVQVLQEHHLKGRLNEFPVIIIPGWSELEPSFKKELLEYAHNGGKLLLTGPGTIKYFSEETGLTSVKENQESFLNLGYQGRFCTLKTPFVEVELPANAKTIGDFYADQDFRSKSIPAAAIIPFGKGEIGMVFSSMGATYIWQRTQLAADFLSDVVGQLIEPAIKVEGSSYIHVNLTSKGNQTLIHLINVAGQHDNEKIYEWAEIPALYNIKIQYKTKKAPKKLTLQPEDKPIEFTYKSGKINLTLPKLNIYSILQIE